MSTCLTCGAQSDGLFCSPECRTQSTKGALAVRNQRKEAKKERPTGIVNGTPFKRIMVTGGRDYDNADTVGAVFNTLKQLYGGGFVIIHGNAKGADRLCAKEAERGGIHHASVNALWDTYGKPAGVLRNDVMLTAFQPSLVISFKGGKGTKHATDLAILYGIETWIITDGIVSYDVEKVNCET